MDDIHVGGSLLISALAPSQHEEFKLELGRPSLTKDRKWLKYCKKKKGKKMDLPVKLEGNGFSPITKKLTK